MLVFLHGVPETAALWDKVRSHIDAESVALALPGFGCPRPDGFGATKDEYVAWVVDQLDQLPGPIDLVGHDWGAGLTYRVATAHGDRLRSWTADLATSSIPITSGTTSPRYGRRPARERSSSKTRTPRPPRPAPVSSKPSACRTMTPSPWPGGATPPWRRASSISTDRPSPIPTPTGRTPGAHERPGPRHPSDG